MSVYLRIICLFFIFSLVTSFGSLFADQIDVQIGVIQSNSSSSRIVWALNELNRLLIKQPQNLSQ